jgi:hypothetical protein
MARFTVTFDVYKDNRRAVLSTTVEATTEFMAVRMAQNKLRAANPTYRSYTWSPKKTAKA